MSEEISYVLITPYTVAKSRTGGVISRLLSRTDLELIGTQIIAPSKEMAEAYAKSIIENGNKSIPRSAELLSNYIKENLAPSSGRRHRVFMMLFKGEDACKKLSDIAGALYPENLSLESLQGETIRDTYADLVMSPTKVGRVRYFEPAVLTPPSQSAARINMKLLADFASKEANLIENMKYSNPDRIERTLVILKPDNWKYASTKPGSIIDMFSRTGLRLVACKLYQMSVAEALEFYGGVENVLQKKLAPIFGKQAREILEDKFNISLDDDVEKGLTDSFGKKYAEDQFFQIVEFMSGTRPDECPEEDINNPGKVKSMLLAYEGVDAIQKIRDVLGPTDPTKAPGGTVRREFGSSIMVNTAHASDSAENSRREMKIVKMNENRLSTIIYDYLEKTGDK